MASSGLTVAVNYVLRVINMEIIKQIGFKRKSQVTSVIMFIVMISTFINTGIMRLITNGRFEFTPFPFNLI